MPVGRAKKLAGLARRKWLFQMASVKVKGLRHEAGSLFITIQYLICPKADKKKWGVNAGIIAGTGLFSNSLWVA